MATVLEFVSGLLDGVGLIALAVSVGGVSFALLVLQIPQDCSRVHKEAVERCLRAVMVGAGALAFVRVVQLILKTWALADITGKLAISAFMSTQLFQSWFVSVCLALFLAGSVAWWRINIFKPGRWTVVVVVVTLFMINQAWLSHAVSRLEGSGSLMVVTVIHMLGAVVWAGGVMHLLLFWRFTRRDPEAATLWPEMVARFSPLGLGSVALILAPGLYLAWSYVGGVDGLLGTGYGNMLLAKITLLVFVLSLAWLNFSAARAWQRSRDRERLDRRSPAFIEAELILAGALLFTAAAITSFPPAVDARGDTASPEEMWTMFSPKVPRLVGPELVQVEAPELTDLNTGQVGYKDDLRWDRFNHNVSGVIVLGIAVLAFLDRRGRNAWVRHWPLLFVAFSLLIVFFANPDQWPLGPLGFLESLKDAEVVQHWLAATVMFGLGLFEWGARRPSAASTKLPFVFPVLSIAGGVLLLTHSHNLLELKREFLVQSTHASMGLLAVIVGCSRWLELRLPAPQNRVPGFLVVACMALIGFILLFYVTPEPDFPMFGRALEERGE